MSNSNSKLRKSIKKNSSAGFGIAEALVSLGILGVVIVGLLSQQRLSVKSSVNVSSDTEINNVMKRVISEIGIQSVCSIAKGTPALPGNFKDRTFADAEMLDLPKLVRSNGESIIVKNAEYGSGQGIVVVENISAKLNTKNNHEMLLTIKFKKKVDKTDTNILKRFTATAIEKELPLTVIMKAAPFATQIEACYGNYDLIVKSAIELACQGAGANYRADLNLPYGECHHQITDLTGGPTPGECPAGMFLKTVAATETTPVTYTCESFQRSCPNPGDFITEFKADGTVSCGKAYVQCSPGQVLVKNGSGQLICTTIDCTTPAVPVRAFSGFDGNGVPVCRDIPTDQSCGSTNFATQVNNDGSVVCNKAVVQAGGCGVGQFISGIGPAGNIICSNWINVNSGCPGGYAISGVDANGALQCKLIRRPLACDGTQNLHSYNDCRAWGGTIEGIYGGNSQCRFNGATCPGGWNRCYAFGHQTTNACADVTNTFYCNTGVTRYAAAGGAVGYGPYAADWAYINSGQGATGCYYNYGYPNTGHACYFGQYTTIYSTQQTVGCY